MIDPSPSTGFQKVFSGERGSAVSACKPYALSFLMGGFYCLIGQIFLTIWGPILGPAFGMPATLLSMGVVGVILYITGIHQKLAPHTGWGSILVSTDSPAHWRTSTRRVPRKAEPARASVVCWTCSSGWLEPVR